MANNVAAILDGIKSSIEAVGKSHEEGIILDNLSFKIDGSFVDTSSDFICLEEANACARDLYEVWEDSLEPPDVYLVYYSDAMPNCISMQLIEMNRGKKQHELDLIVNLWKSDVVQELAQDILISQIFLNEVIKLKGWQVFPGRITFNVGLGIVKWTDSDPFEIEIPR